MKKQQNMSIEELRRTGANFQKKHRCRDDYKLTAEQMGAYRTGLSGDTAADHSQIIADIFNVGYMAGYKHLQEKQRAAFESRTAEHREFIKYVWNLPCGLYSQFYHHFMIFDLKNRTENQIMDWYTPKQRKKVDAFLQNYEEEKAVKKALQEVEEKPPLSGYEQAKTDIVNAIYQLFNNKDADTWVLQQIHRAIVNFQK